MSNSMQTEIFKVLTLGAECKPLEWKLAHMNASSLLLLAGRKFGKEKDLKVTWPLRIDLTFIETSLTSGGLEEQTFSAWGFKKTQGFIAEVLLSDCLRCRRFLWWWDFFSHFSFLEFEKQRADVNCLLPSLLTMQRTRFFKYLLKEFPSFSHGFMYVLCRHLVLRASFHMKDRL